MRMMYCSVVTNANPEKEIPSALIRSRTLDLTITSSNALPLPGKQMSMMYYSVINNTGKLGKEIPSVPIRGKT